MISLLLLLLAAYVIYKAVVLKRRIDAMRRQFHRDVEEAQRQYGMGAEQCREKRYGSDDGEYVEFEEVAAKDEAEPAAAEASDPGAAFHSREELISDAEYEEVRE